MRNEYEDDQAKEIGNNPTITFKFNFPVTQFQDSKTNLGRYTCTCMYNTRAADSKKSENKNDFIP